MTFEWILKDKEFTAKKNQYIRCDIIAREDPTILRCVINDGKLEDRLTEKGMISNFSDDLGVYVNVIEIDKGKSTPLHIDLLGDRGRNSDYIGEVWFNLKSGLDCILGDTEKHGKVLHCK